MILAWNLRGIDDTEVQSMGQGKEDGCIILLVISNNVLDLNSPVFHPYVYGACHWCSLDKPDFHGLFQVPTEQTIMIIIIKSINQSIIKLLHRGQLIVAIA